MTDPTPETPPPAPEEPQQAPEQRGLTGAVVRRLTWLLVGSGVLAVGGGALWGGVDFAGAVLLGFLIVLLNFVWTKRAVGAVLFDERPKALLTLSYLVKFGLTGVVLFYAILRYGVDALGVLVGLSTLLVAAVALSLLPRGGKGA